jgi:putative colanic acid biosysnthesis UDP-glucose lipid carrier transferase
MRNQNHYQQTLTIRKKHFRALPAFKDQNRLSRVTKRSFDIIFSLLVIVFILSWMLPILALLVKLSSKGPVFFIQERIGAKGQIFKCFKLRSMVVNAQANVKQAAANDPRITPIGRFLRDSCMDELPQFINVLIGDMSIVGPRPHMVKDCEDFSKLVSNYGYRHSVKPGITGMAQVKGYRGETHCIHDISHRYRWDVFYVNNYSFLLDIKIIYRTFVQTVAAVLNLSEDKLSQTKVNSKPVELHKVTVIDHYSDQLVEA